MLLLHRIRCFIFPRGLTGLLALLFLLLPIAGCANPPEPLQFTDMPSGIPAEALKSPVVGDLPTDKKLHVGITFKLNPNWLKQVESQKIEPGKPSRLEEFANKIGIDDATYEKIKGFFNPQEVSLKLNKLRTRLTVDAKASTLAKVFQTKFVLHKYKDRTFYAPATPPKVPKFLANFIEAITGLDNYSAAPKRELSMQFGTPQNPKVSEGTKKVNQDCSPAEQTILPRDVANVYGFEELWNRGWHGENMTINVLAIDAFYEEDIQNYLECIDFQGKISVVNVGGAPREAVGEATLDVQMIAGLARSSNIVVYQSDISNTENPWVNINDELQQILDDNVNNANSGSVVSISLGTDEPQMSADDIKAIDSSLQQLTRVEHMTVFVASGDCGAFNRDNFGQLAVSFPASDPWATAVGGTILQVDGNRNRVDEFVWADDSQRELCENRWGSGGGNSELFKQPDWQNGSGVENQHSQDARQLPDVSAVAYALAVYFEGQWGAVGGTSASAPIWATAIALVNQGLLQEVGRFGYSPQMFYEVANKSDGLRPYHDITRGDNLHFPATPGWDYSTGLGTPNLADFYQVLSRSLR